ncbi:hypothetical protein Lfu02_40870 [Longispora fulva]|uniref:Uncharacterized protein n=1 Tax=Longispora fulva TaxID=619741 RepID=A0A8J7GPG8_9ACTN|nr:DUF6331 family protein [Longispora fulva]MBG6136544.1 hypothetical protein [Longispora fulva]GIG59715.1 hypothetical protein Lfu02_40870 [Longispora fulva]
MEDVSVEVLSPLSECIDFCETECFLDCCGIDALSADRTRVQEWCHQAGSVVVHEARLQLAALIEVVENRSYLVTSTFLNHRTHDEAARRELLDFLVAIDAGLAAVDAS